MRGDSGQRVEHLAPQLGRDAIREPPLKRQRDERAGIEQPGRPAGILAGGGVDRLLVDRVVHRLERQPGQHGGFGRREQGVVRLHGGDYNYSLP